MSEQLRISFFSGNEPPLLTVSAYVNGCRWLVETGPKVARRRFCRISHGVVRSGLGRVRLSIFTPGTAA